MIADYSLKLSDCGTLEEFIGKAIDRTCLGDVIRIKRDDGDCFKIARCMELIEELEELVKDNDLQLWLASDYRGCSRIAVAWGGYFISQLQFEKKDGEWFDVPMIESELLEYAKNRGMLYRGEE